ncbi:Eukaryotic translation initiation factor 4 gamma [Leucoagaricus sp. SymC.cos]|nr:Eukaryotic translation initiation factor 4 gamma [Leucoagaricus sp. SymC.cos]
MNLPVAVDRQVRHLLNKLTTENFESTSDQIIEWANKSEHEKDGKTLIRVIQLVYDKAMDDPGWSDMYARLCRKMMEQISNKVQDDGVKDSLGNPLTGGQLFRKHLLNRCREDFEGSWADSKPSIAVTTTTKTGEDHVGNANTTSQERGDETGEIEPYFQESYAIQRAKRKGVALVKFLGELFKLRMLGERIMHECVKKLLGNAYTPKEEETDAMRESFKVVGKVLDTSMAHAHMDVYFRRMRELAGVSSLSPRAQSQLQVCGTIIL